mgnify:CR=1 FL=1
MNSVELGKRIKEARKAAKMSQTELANAIGKTPVVDVIPVGIISGFSTVVITLIMSYFSLVLGELVPKKIAMSKPEKMAFMAAPILVFVLRTFVCRFLAFCLCF